MPPRRTYTLGPIIEDQLGKLRWKGLYFGAGRALAQWEGIRYEPGYARQ